MADEIRQSMGFDAAQALQTLERLNKAFDSFGGHVDQLADKLRKFNSGSNATETATTKLASAFNSNMGASAESVGRLTTSMQLMSRIIFTQFIIRQLRILRTTFQETAEDAAQFQRKIAEISTIAPGATQGQLARSVREISDNLNIPLLDTASGVYQALSNNIGGVAESLELTESAARFAKATNSSLKDSVDLLSGSINAFGLTVQDSDRLSGIFFKAIETGRVTATELANSLGRVQGRAAALGVSVEETAAALAVVTTSGINSSEAITQLSGVLTALTKPTDEMAAALKRLGFESSEAAIATLGLPDLLKRLGDSTDGTSASLAKLFPNVRGIAGQLNLTNQNLATFADLITSAKNAGNDFAASKFLQATATDAERFTSEINKLKNALTVDLGQGLLKAAADTAQFVGGADNVIGAVKILSPLVLSASAALLGYAVSSRAAAAASSLLATRLGPVGVALAVLGAASSAGRAIDSAFFSGALDGFKELERAAKKSLDDFKAIESEKVAAADRANEERVRLALQSVADLNKVYLKDRDNAKAANDALVQNTKDSVRDIVSVREQLVDELARTSADARKFSTDSQLRVADLQTARNDRRFNDEISRLSESQQVFALTQRAAQQAQAASKAFIAAAQAGDERGLRWTPLVGRPIGLNKVVGLAARGTPHRSRAAAAAA
ncbi:MAG TPA: phage tail tape measure protein [Anaerolineae bacterium]